MKLLVILGALLGFVLGGGFSLAGQSPWPTVLWRASIGSLGTAFLARWWGRVWLANLHAAHQSFEVNPPDANSIKSKSHS